jgi:hypothetical protein
MNLKQLSDKLISNQKFTNRNSEYIIQNEIIDLGKEKGEQEWYMIQ